MSTLSHLFQINSDNAEVQRKGRLIQILVASLSLIAFSRAVILLVGATVGGWGEPTVNLLHLVVQAVAVLLFGLLCLLVTRNGRPRLAAHLFFITFNFVTFYALAQSTTPKAFPYLMLISVVAIAILDSVRISIVYAFLTTAIVLGQLLIANMAGFEFILTYLVTATGISLSTWLVAGDLRQALQETDRLAQNLQRNTQLLEANTAAAQWRAHRLQVSAEISQITSTHLDLPKLLHNTVYLIRDQFDFYHVSIFLLDIQKKYLVLHEATGNIGKTLKQKYYKQPIKPNTTIGWVATNQKPRVAANTAVETSRQTEPLLAETRSELALPLIARGELLGVLDVQSREPEAFQEEDISILQILANQVAVNIDNARLFEQTETRLNETQTLFELNALLTTTLDVGEIYRRAARAFTREFAVPRCALSSWEREANTVTTRAEFVHDIANEMVDTFDMDYQVYDLANHPGTLHTLQTHEPLIRYADDPDLEESERKILQDLDQSSCLELPLVRGDEAIGIVELFRTAQQPPFNLREIQLAQAMANQTAIALENATLASEARARVAQLSTLNRLSIKLSLAPTLKEVFTGARREIMSMIEATGMSIVLLTPEGDKLNWVYGFEYGEEVDLSNISPLPITAGFSGQVVKTRESVLINKHISEKRKELQSKVVGAEPSTWLGLPMIVANELIGVLSVENAHDPDAFHERDIELLKTVAGPLAIAINNLLQFEQVQTALAAQFEQRLQLQTAAEVAAAATSILELSELIQQAVDLIKERFTLYYVGLFLIDPESSQAVLKAGTGEAGRIQLKQRHALPVGGHSLIGGATGDGMPRITQDVTQDKEWRSNPILPNTRAELALPLRVRGRIIGALTVQSAQPNAFSDELISTLQTMSDQLAVAIENAQLLASAETRAQRQRELNEISARLYRSADIDEIINVGLEALSERLGTRDIILTLGKEDGEENGRIW